MHPGMSPADQDEEEPRGLLAWLRAHLHIIIGIMGLVAWLVMLWLMFGDVL